MSRVIDGSCHKRVTLLNRAPPLWYFQSHLPCSSLAEYAAPMVFPGNRIAISLGNFLWLTQELSSGPGAITFDGARGTQSLKLKVD